jgi:RecB family endonuclease NucS
MTSKIARDYSQSGRFSTFGYEQHSRYRAAILRYSEFFVCKDPQSSTQDSVHAVEKITSDQEKEAPRRNFAYERDLQTTLCAQVSELFPGYKIYGELDSGVEFSIDNRRIDVLLEHIEDGDLLAVELKSGAADYKVFGQISMYLGILKEKFPDKRVQGVIVAGAIEVGLRQACEITDLIELKIYRMSIELENA